MFRFVRVAGVGMNTLDKFHAEVRWLFSKTEQRHPYEIQGLFTFSKLEAVTVIKINTHFRSQVCEAFLHAFMATSSLRVQKWLPCIQKAIK